MDLMYKYGRLITNPIIAFCVSAMWIILAICAAKYSMGPFMDNLVMNLISPASSQSAQALAAYNKYYMNNNLTITPDNVAIVIKSRNNDINMKTNHMAMKLELELADLANTTLWEKCPHDSDVCNVASDLVVSWVTLQNISSVVGSRFISENNYTALAIFSMNLIKPSKFYDIGKDLNTQIVDYVKSKNLDGTFQVGVVSSQLLINGISTAVMEELHHMDMISIPIILCILFIVFHSAGELIPAIISLLVCLVIPFGVCHIYVGTDASKAPLSFTPAIMMSLTIAFGIDFNLFIITRFNEEVGRRVPFHWNPLKSRVSWKVARECVAISVATSGKNVLVSGLCLITCVGSMGCVTLLKYTFGIPLLMSVTFVLIVNLSLTPALLSLFYHVWMLLSWNFDPDNKKFDPLAKFAKLFKHKWFNWSMLVFTTIIGIVFCAVAAFIKPSLALSQAFPGHGIFTKNYNLLGIDFPESFVQPFEILIEMKDSDATIFNQDVFNFMADVIPKKIMDIHVDGLPDVTYDNFVNPAAAPDLPNGHLIGAPAPNTPINPTQALMMVNAQNCTQLAISATTLQFQATIKTKLLVAAKEIETTDGAAITKQITDKVMANSSIPDADKQATITKEVKATILARATAKVHAEMATDPDFVATAKVYGDACATTKIVYKQNLAPYYHNGKKVPVIMIQLMPNFNIYSTLAETYASKLMDVRNELNTMANEQINANIWINSLVMVSVDSADSVYKQLTPTLGVLTAGIWCVIAVAFRSVVAPFHALFYVFIVISFSFGVAQACRKHAFGAENFYFIIPPSTALILGGLTMDYFLFSQMRVMHERMEHSIQKAIFKTIQHNSGVIFIAGLLMVIAFCVLISSDLAVLRMFGVVMVTAVIMAAWWAQYFAQYSLDALIGDWYFFNFFNFRKIKEGKLFPEKAAEPETEVPIVAEEQGVAEKESELHHESEKEIKV